VERAQHRPVAAEHDDELRVVVHDLRARLAGHGTHAFDRLFEAVALAQQEPDALDRPTRRLRR
jgi:hypothetical protein